MDKERAIIAIKQMSIKEKYEVRTVQSWECKEWLLWKHYAKRMPSISYAFGLYDIEKHLVGVMTIGKPASPSLCTGVCGAEYSSFVFELNRLVVNEGLGKNVLSFFVANAFKLIADDLIVVSYADSALGHHGYIYQATNWIYTGLSASRTDPKGQDNQHGRHIKCDGVAERIERSRKHRYLYFLGKRSKQFKKALKYTIQPYPKGDNKRYDASYEPITQNVLF